MKTAVDTEITPVVFRVWRHNPKTVLALFPTLPADRWGGLCESYEHVGQHGGADYYGCIAATRPATPAEAVLLVAELTGRGYNLRVFQRASNHHHQQRRDAARG